MQKEIRPVFKEELDFFEMYKVWNYPDTDAPILWAEGIRKYILNGTVIAEAKGGSFYEKAKIVVKDPSLTDIGPIDVEKLLTENRSLLDGLTQRAIARIREVYEEYEGILFNKAYRHGLFRVGCVVCPMSSAWWDSTLILRNAFIAESASQKSPKDVKLLVRYLLRREEILWI